jgi:hydroxyacylglutathione hydrolase
MRFEIVTVPCLKDNYAFLLHDSTSGETAVFDVPEAAPIAAALAARGWTLTDIVLTHHHPDHIDGVPHLPGNARLIGAEADAHRLPALDVGVRGGDRLTVCGTEMQVIEGAGPYRRPCRLSRPGGRRGLYRRQPDGPWLRPPVRRDAGADVGQPVGAGVAAAPTRWSVPAMNTPPRTAGFALTVDPAMPPCTTGAQAVGSARAEGRPTVPSTLAEELATNPFLRAGDAGLKSQLGMGRRQRCRGFHRNPRPQGQVLTAFSRGTGVSAPSARHRRNAGDS